MIKRLIVVLLCAAMSPLLAAEEADARAHYIANMGAMIEHGDTKILFDPLFRNNFDTYDLTPAKVETALLAGFPPWDSIDAVFVSHYHEDHFDPASVLNLLRRQVGVVLFAPEQAAAAIRELVASPEDPVLERIRGLSLANGEAAADIELGSLRIEAIRIPHGGWPTRHAHVENIVYRVTIDDATTVMHFGDADSQDEHFANTETYWSKRPTHFAMPPYWFFLSDEGRRILQHRIGAEHTVGMHVPTEIPENRIDRSAELQDVDLFTRPGETRWITVEENSGDPSTLTGNSVRHHLPAPSRLYSE